VTEATTLQIERLIDASRDVVFALWTTKAAMEAWYRDGDGWSVRVTELDVRVGGRYRVEFGPPGATPFVESGVYLEIDPPTRLVMTETIEGVDTPWADTRVTVELRDEDGKTRLVLLHEGFPSSHERDAAAGGWPGFLDRIEALARARGA
jgi:uncharacterized protein YndB with AHSA1/START domain